MNSSRPRGNVTYNNSGRVALVTGGASGIGRSVCEAFLSSSATVVCVDVDADLARQLPKDVDFLQGDTSNEEDCRRAVEWAVENRGGLDVLVNNAAIQPPESYVPVDQLSSPLLRRMVEVNFVGYTLMAKHALGRMAAQRSGVVINVASGQAHRTARGVPVYGPVKAANVLQAKQWGVQYARDGVRVVSVSPGAIDTPLVRASLRAQGGAGELANRHPIGRIGRPEEVAQAILWLASDDASFITATDVEVDGGLGAFGAFADPFPFSD